MVPKQEIMIKRLGVPYHLSLDDHVRDLGADFSARRSHVAVGSVGMVWANALEIPSASLPMFEKKAPGRGVRNYDVEGKTWREICAALGIELPSHLQSARTRLHVYKCSYNLKRVSPAYQNGVFSLAVCGTLARRAVATDVARIRCMVTLEQGRVKAAVVVGSVLAAWDYHSMGLQGAKLVPSRCKRTLGR